MMIDPIGAFGVSDISYGGYSSDGGSAASVYNKISDLKRQREEYIKNGRSADVSSLDRRIDNLEKRLDKLEKTDGECQTCKNRKYQDGSDDPGVSFKSPSKVSPEAADAAVRGHENEHVMRNRAKAEREGKEIVYQNVTIKTDICPECGKVFTSGGETETVTRTKSSPENKYGVGLSDGSPAIGSLLDKTA